ncbi:MAG: histidine kinase N-terminal 7TM domain-containing protein [Cyanobacteria bacterium P01_D01_bin.36]
MLLYENIYVVILCLAAIVSGCVALTAWIRKESTPSARPFTWLMCAIAAYATAAAGSEAAHNVERIVTWTTLEYIASSSVITFYLIFTLHFTGLQQWLTPKRQKLLWIIPLFNIGLVISNQLHGLVWTDFTVHPGNTHLNIIHHGHGYYWIAAFFYIYVVTGSVLIIRTALISTHLYRRQALTIIAGALPPILAGSLFTLGLSPEHANILPMSFLLTGLIYFGSLFSVRLFDLLPVARDTLIERMNDGVLVINHEYRILDINPAARRFTTDSASCTGKKIEQVLSSWQDLINLCYLADDSSTHIIERPETPRYIEMRVTYLHDRHNKVTGKLIVLRDITENHQNQLQIQQVNSELTFQLTKVQKLRDQLKEQAIRDSLTGLFNRRYFEETLPAELTKAERAGTSLSIVLMDIDYFKKVNDTYGHLAGDLALRTFAKFLQQRIRKSDIACRYGGEEFILAMPGISIEEAYQRAENIRLALKEITIEFDGVGFGITTSMGLDAFPNFSGAQEEMLKRIDQALYVAKANGRDRIEVASEKATVISKLSELENAIATSRSAAKS